MRFLAPVLVVYQGFILVYFAVLNLLYALFGYLGLRSVIVYSRELPEVALKDLLEREFYKPVSILVPANNEEAGIVPSIRSMLSLHYPEFEVVVANDGSTDATLDRLIDAFALVEVPQIYRRRLETSQVVRVFRSLRHPNLTVIDKKNGGRSDALNAAVNLARYPLVCSVDAGSLLEAEALLRASRLFLEDETIVAVGGTVRPLNGTVVREGQVVEVNLPPTWLERFQVLEYARGFFTGRSGWSRFGALLIISGAFGVFRREAVIDVGGYTRDTVTEDLELVMRFHRRYRRERRPYRIIFQPDPICWTEVPSDLHTLRQQRNWWHRGLWETLWRYRGMLFNPRYGKVGMLGLPYFWLFEAISPVVEVTGYLLLPVTFFLGVLHVPFAVLFVLLALLYGILLSEMAVGIETMLLARYPRLRDRLLLLLAAFLEFMGYHQILAVERFVVMFQIRRRRGIWGPTGRKGIGSQPAPRSYRFEPSLVTRPAGKGADGDPRLGVSISAESTRRIPGRPWRPPWRKPGSTA
jgi:cellulose synthase/poly-beta-1,6-N-acetylglucosamine synthase-like glycosyltransferase